jgi:hexosaminidase
MPDLRLEQAWSDASGGANGSLVFRIHHLSGASVTPDRFCYCAQAVPSRDVQVTGGRLVRVQGTYVEIATEGVTLAPGDIWEVELRGLAYPPATHTQGALSAWLEAEGNLLELSVGDLQPPSGRALGGPRDWPAGEVAVPICLLPWPAKVAIDSFGPPVLLHPGDAALKAPMAQVAALHRRLFPMAPAPFTLDASPEGRAVTAEAGPVPAGGFRLDFGPRITVNHSDDDGLRHGLIALAQMADAARTDSRFQVPQTGIITDHPRHGWRGLHLDVSRNFMKADRVLRVLDLMAWHRLNRFHWHLTDDEGWRVPIDGMPQLTEIGARRGPGLALLPQYSDGPAGRQGQYSVAEVHSIVAHGRALGIETMPEIDLPGHSTALLAALPHLRDPDEPADSYRSIQGFPNNALNPGIDATWPALEVILDGICALFPFEVIHLGGDEVDAASWALSPAAQALVEREGLAPGAAALQSHFMRRVQQMLRDRGRRMAGWDECADGGGVDTDALLFAWRTREKTAALMAAGYEVICTPGQAYYLDMTQAPGWNSPGAAWAGVSTPEDCYHYEPTDELPMDAGRLGGVQAAMWTEHVGSTDRFNALAFPRLSAVAEAAWSPTEAKSWPRFAAVARLMPQL